MLWQEIAGNWVIVPERTIGIIHFLGGAFIGTAPHVTYRWLLEQLAESGFTVVTVPFLNTFNHTSIARDVLNRFETIRDRLYSQKILTDTALPVYGVGHSMGCKIHLLIGSLYEVERAGNVFISYNNFPVNRSIPFAEQLQLTPAFNLEFSPSPEETSDLIAQEYKTRRNFLIKFRRDSIDQTYDLHPVLRSRFPDMVSLKILPGDHITPINQEIGWQTGEVFTPIDAIAQWFKHETSKNLQSLKKELIFWLNPLQRTVADY
ncbi:MAG: DUF1350 family protein [Cyanobacteria bacterium P01_E01_bin.42]